MHGGLAEKCLVAADQLIAMPDKVTFEEAASLPVAYGTAHRMIITHNTIKRDFKPISRHFLKAGFAIMREIAADNAPDA